MLLKLSDPDQFDAIKEFFLGCVKEGAIVVFDGFSHRDGNLEIGLSLPSDSDFEQQMRRRFGDKTVDACK